ncbi:RNA polymerase Rpb1 [Aphelenchoides avenae]|nr:RNA polymerase Rpb1 [Aphelenchus avenae]
MGKQQFRQPDHTRKVTGVKFGAGSVEEIRQASHIQIFNNKLYEESTGKWSPAAYGPLDTRLVCSMLAYASQPLPLQGTFQKTVNCETCGMNLTDCVGHFGYIDLEYPVFHVGFFRLIIQLLQCICKSCASTLLNGEQKLAFMRQIHNPNLDYLRRKVVHKKVVEASKKISTCPHCGFLNGVVKKAVGAVLKIAHGEPIKDDYLQEFENARENKELQNLVPAVKFNLMDPMKVQNLFRRIKQEDVPLLMVRAEEKRHPIDLLMRRIPVPPVCIRPSVVSELKSGTNEDDLTMKLTEIMMVNEVLKKHKRDGAPMKTISETWDHLQVQCALYINSELSGLPPDMQPKKFLRSFAQRLKGKQGRFRGNLSGKRVDFSGRTVISPDPNLKVDQVGVPVHVAKTLTFPEIVNASNIERLRRVVINGDSIHPGANHVVDRKTGNKKFLRYGNRELVAKNLQYGDIVERHLDDNDIVLFQPSTIAAQDQHHGAPRESHAIPNVQAFIELPRFNECACTPYNADFDGDEMNLHLPQTYEARAEASLLMGLKSNLVTPRSGEPLIAAIQDFITAGYLLTHKDTFLTRSEVHRLASSLVDVNARKQQRIKLPKPAIFKPVELWTGKQLVELIISPFVDSNIRMNLSARNKSHGKADDDWTANDTFVRIHNNQLLSGALDKSLLGSGSKTNIFYILLRDYGEDSAIEAMWRLARMSPVFLSNRGFSIGIGDVKPTEGLLKEQKKLLSNGYTKVEDYIASVKAGKLKAQPGCTEMETLESLILGELSMIREHAGKACLYNLSVRNTPLTMAVCGSKGSFINISQMIACVGQQSISGKRPPDGFENRSLPHFDCNDKSPQAKGFVENSFYSGLTPTEFFFHTMAGREGLVDTAVKTAETGYMQRRLVKCLEDLAVNYDNTVRTSTGEIVQFRFGEDGLDPAFMEAKDGSVVDFNHILEHVRNTNVHKFDPSSHLDPEDLLEFIRSTIDQRIDFDQHRTTGTVKSQHNHDKFKRDVFEFLENHVHSTERYFSLQERCEQHKKFLAKCDTCKAVKRRQLLIQSNCINHSQAIAFIEMCAEKIKKAVVEPGSAVGAIAATSIGEPSTQMTLKTFHFAGVASMNITQGVPRIKEIINAVRNISTPIITVALANDKDEKLARRVKARIEKTTLGEISDYIEQVFLPDDLFVLIKLNSKRIRLLQLEVTMDSILASISNAKLPLSLKGAYIRSVGRTMIMIRPPETDKCSKMMAMHYLKYYLAAVVVKGLPNVTRCIIHADEKKGDSYSLLVEGTDYKDVLAIMEIDGRRTKFNNASMVAEVLGIEAARASIIKEILATMGDHGIDLDRRHVMLLADLMTYRGEVLGITRNGLVKMKESVLLLASFERTTDHLFEAAFFGQMDKIVGVSECIIMGTPMPVGTGMFKLLYNRGPVSKAEDLRRPAIFESPELNLQI